MTVTCPSCHASLTIPDERLPKGKVVTAACPRCKGPIAIDLTGAVSPSLPQATPPTPAPSPAPPASAPESGAGAPEEAVSYGERAQPRALVCMSVPAERQQVVSCLKQAEYAPQAAKDSADAIEKLRFAVYAVVVFRDDFNGAGGGGPSLSAYLAEMAMATRRNIHVVLVSPAVTTHDTWAAFIRSVDLVLNPKDLPHLTEAMKLSRAEADIRQRVLKESLHALGKT